jgi:hypothetical protein
VAERDKGFEQLEHSPLCPALKLNGSATDAEMEIP